MRVKTRHKIVRTFEEVKQVVEWCKQTRYCSFDFETKATGPYGPTVSDDKKPTGPQYKEDEPTTLSITFQIGSAYVIPLFHFKSPFSRAEALQILKYVGLEIMEDTKVVKVGYNLKFEYRWFRRYGIFFKGICLDMMLAKYLLDEERPNDLKSLVTRKIPDYAGYEDEIHALVRKAGGWGKIELKPLAKYNAIDSNVTLILVNLLEKKLIKNNFYRLFRNMCMMQVRVLAESESMGVNVDVPYLKNLVKVTGKDIELKLHKLINRKSVRKFQRWRIQQKIKKLIKETQTEINLIKEGKPVGKKKEVYAYPDRAIKNREQKLSNYISGNLKTKKERVEDFNPGSPDQVVDFLYLSPRGLNLDIVKYTKDKETKRDTERPSTDEEALLVLEKKDKSGFISALLKYREITKLYSTYMVAMEYRLTPKKKVHPSYLIHGTVTGRLSSKNPNFQNIPRDITNSAIKRMFIPPPKHVLVEVDYGQAELRVVAEMSGDKAMIEIFKRNYNVHVATGCKLVKKFDEYEKVKGILKNPEHPENIYWEKQKKKGKVLNFSILYLQSDEETANQMGVRVSEAKQFKADWFDSFPDIKRWMAEQEMKVRRDGFVMNLFGRKRRLPDIYSDNRGKVNKSIRDAVNAPIQGGSSDFTQFATITLREKIIKGELELTDYLRYLSQVYTVHDSIGFYVMPKYLRTAIPIIEEVCSNPDTQDYFGFDMKEVKMKVSPEVGKTWGGLIEYKESEDYTKWVN